MRDAGSILVRLQAVEMRIASRMEADNGKVKAIVGAQNLSVAFGGGLNSKARRAYCKSIEKFTSCNQFVSPFKPAKCASELVA